jgi:hypothetical protein
LCAFELVADKQKAQRSAKQVRVRKQKMGQGRSHPDAQISSLVKESPFREFCYALRRPTDPDLETTARRIRSYYEYLTLTKPDLAYRIAECGATNPSTSETCRSEYDSKDFPQWQCDQTSYGDGNETIAMASSTRADVDDDDLLGIVVTTKSGDQIACISRSGLLQAWNNEGTHQGVLLDGNGHEFGVVRDFNEITLPLAKGGGTFLVIGDSTRRLGKNPGVRLWRLKHIASARIEGAGKAKRAFELSAILLPKQNRSSGRASRKATFAGPVFVSVRSPSHQRASNKVHPWPLLH